MSETAKRLRESVGPFWDKVRNDPECGMELNAASAIALRDLCRLAANELDGSDAIIRGFGDLQKRYMALVETHAETVDKLAATETKLGAVEQEAKRIRQANVEAKMWVDAAREDIRVLTSRLGSCETALHRIIEAWDGDSESMHDDPAEIAREALGLAVEEHETCDHVWSDPSINAVPTKCIKCGTTKVIVAVGDSAAVEKQKPPECPYCFPKDGKHAASCELASASEEHFPPCPCGDECEKDDVVDGRVCKVFGAVTPFDLDRQESYDHGICEHGVPAYQTCETCGR